MSAETATTTSSPRSLGRSGGTRRRQRIGIAVALICLSGGAATVALRSHRSSPGFGGVSIKASPSYQNETLLKLAWELPVARLYGRYVDAQRNPSTCGPSSLANVERSFGVPRGEESILHGTATCWLGICLGGLTLDELAGLARVSTVRHVTVLRDLQLPRSSVRNSAAQTIRTDAP